MNKFSDFLNALIGQKGQGTLADEIGVDGATLSKFRSGQGAINLSAIDKIFQITNVVIIPREDLKKLENALETLSDLWKEERRKKNGK